MEQEHPSRSEVAAQGPIVKDLLESFTMLHAGALQLPLAVRWFRNTLVRG
jgi:hypothetical protein